jgi:putative transposase
MACGVARFTWNWALDQLKKKLANGEKTTTNKLKLEWNRIKHEQFPWVLASPKDANDRPFFNLSTAISRFFKGTAKFPTFKKKSEHDSFYVSSDRITVTGMTIRLPVIGWIRSAEALRFSGRIVAASVIRIADRWFVSVKVDVGDYSRCRGDNEEVGIDLGISTAVVLSSGKTFSAPRPLRRMTKKVKRLYKQLSKKVDGSSNRYKAKIKLARQHARIKNIRSDWIHKITSRICRENQTIVLEDLNVKGMVSNHCLAKAISDIGFREIRRQIEYKANIYKNKVIIINRWLPSSKTCSNCGCKKDKMLLSDRVFNCGHCGATLDRDLNAAKNILAAGLAAIACGSEGAGLANNSKPKPCRYEAGTTQEGIPSVPSVESRSHQCRFGLNLDISNAT